MTRSQLQQTIDVANNVQTNAAGIHLRAAQRTLDELVPAPTAAPADPREKAGRLRLRRERRGTQDLIAERIRAPRMNRRRHPADVANNKPRRRLTPLRETRNAGDA